MKVLQFIAVMFFLFSSAKASCEDRAYRYRSQDTVVSYQVPKELAAAYTRVREHFESNEDRVIYTTAFTVRKLFTEKSTGNFTMAVVAMPDELRVDHTTAKLEEYYKTKFQNEQENVTFSTHRVGKREWLRIETSLKKSSGSCSGIWFYQPISKEYILGVALVTAQGDSWSESQLKKLLPAVEKVVESIECTSADKAAKPAK